MNFLEFKEWVSSPENNVTEYVGQLLTSWTNFVLQQMHVKDKRVSINFPKNFSEQTEAELERLHRHEKGYQAYKGLSKVTNVNDLGWNKTQQYRFKSNLTHAVKHVAQDLGFLFEMEVYLYLKRKGLHEAIDVNIEQLRNQRIDLIAPKLGTAKDQILQMVVIHAQHLGSQIVERTKRLLGCADMIWFSGGVKTTFNGRENPADIQIGCSEYSGKHDRAGYSVKFGSETRISVAHLTINGLADIVKNNKIVKKINSIEEDDNWAANVSEEIKNGLNKYENNPAEFVKLLNRLLTGGNFTFPAARNYASTELGGAEWSENFRKDFIVSDSPVNPLKARSNATVTVTAVASYAKIRYKVDGGSFDGTNVFFVPRNGEIDVKITNLTSSRR